MRKICSISVGIKAWALASGLIAAAAASAILATGADATVIYNDIPSALPGNVFSVSFEATEGKELGSAVAFLPGPARAKSTVTVVMSSWGCEKGHWPKEYDNCETTPGATFTEPITLNIYKPGTSFTEGSPPGSLITSVTKTFAIPYRPSADNVHCTGASLGAWYDESEHTCYNGLALPITFEVPNYLPNEAIISLAYNTSHYGYHPYGEATACYTSAGGCGYDSLNVGSNNPSTPPSTPSVGSNPLPHDVYWNTSYAPYYCTEGPWTGTFALDGPCWTEEQPMIEVEAGIPGPPTATILSPPNHGIYVQNEVVATEFSCEDAAGGGPGIESCKDSNGAPASTGTLNTSTGGEHQYTVTAKSKDGQSGTASISYEVEASPTVVTGAASSITPTEATLNATVNPDEENVTHCYFEYGTSIPYGMRSPCSSLPGSGGSPVGVSAALMGLNPNTTFHFRIVATNALGTSYGSDQTFKTQPLPVPTVTGVSPNRGLTSGGTTVTITGTHFTEATEVKFGSEVASFHVNSDTSITATSPRGKKGIVDVNVTTPGGRSPITKADRFKYKKHK